MLWFPILDGYALPLLWPHNRNSTNCGLLWFHHTVILHIFKVWSPISSNLYQQQYLDHPIHTLLFFLKFWVTLGIEINISMISNKILSFHENQVFFSLNKAIPRLHQPNPRPPTLGRSWTYPKTNTLLFLWWKWHWFYFFSSILRVSVLFPPNFCHPF